MDLDQARRIVEEPETARAAVAELLGSHGRRVSADEIRLIMAAFRAMLSELARVAGGGRDMSGMPLATRSTLDMARVIADEGGAEAAVEEVLTDLAGELRRTPTGDEIRLLMRCMDAMRSVLARRAAEADAAALLAQRESST